MIVEYPPEAERTYTALANFARKPYSVAGVRHYLLDPKDRAMILASLSAEES